jgi:D-serine deaminase-like pyridoxal phosphate-dependent protein
MFHPDNITVPTLLIHREKCRANIRMMKDKADASGVQLIPHFKTHQSAEVGSWFRDSGTTAITVSSLSMATFFAGHGWNDITVAFPVNLREMKTINKLASEINLRVFILSVDTAEALAGYLENPVDFYIEIETGNKRSGVDWNDYDLINAILEKSSSTEKLNFIGFYTHDGNTYEAAGRNEILKIHQGTRQKLSGLRDRYKSRYPGVRIALGDTPACSLADDFSGLDEIRPGNYVYYDVTQAVIGSCGFDRIAVVLAAPVVAKNEERLELVVYGGGVHLSKDSVDTGGRKIYGIPVHLTDTGWLAPNGGCCVRKISQEHGIISVTRNVFDLYRVGDVIGILPVHSCMTMDLMRFNGELIVV